MTPIADIIRSSFILLNGTIRPMTVWKVNICKGCGTVGNIEVTSTPIANGQVYHFEFSCCGMRLLQVTGRTAEGDVLKSITDMNPAEAERAMMSEPVTDDDVIEIHQRLAVGATMPWETPNA